MKRQLWRSTLKLLAVQATTFAGSTRELVTTPQAYNNMIRLQIDVNRKSVLSKKESRLVGANVALASRLGAYCVWKDGKTKLDCSYRRRYNRLMNCSDYRKRLILINYRDGVDMDNTKRICSKALHFLFAKNAAPLHRPTLKQRKSSRIRAIAAMNYPLMNAE
jgi:hypothetical protein